MMLGAQEVTKAHPLPHGVEPTGVPVFPDRRRFIRESGAEIESIVDTVIDTNFVEARMTVPPAEEGPMLQGWLGLLADIALGRSVVPPNHCCRTADLRIDLTGASLEPGEHVFARANVPARNGDLYLAAAELHTAAGALIATSGGWFASVAEDTVHPPVAHASAPRFPDVAALMRFDVVDRGAAHTEFELAPARAGEPARHDARRPGAGADGIRADRVRPDRQRCRRARIDRAHRTPAPPGTDPWRPAAGDRPGRAHRPTHRDGFGHPHRTRRQASRDRDRDVRRLSEPRAPRIAVRMVCPHRRPCVGEPAVAFPHTST